ncbi:MAG TPA: diguanylate cyclase [Phycisphaerae bacterium]|nr:diguanylate cyclase [Phycisphaerae bacterium]
MTTRRPLSIQKALGLAIAVTACSLVLGAGALLEYQLRRAAGQAEQLRTITLAQAYAAQAAPLLETGRTGEIAAFVDRLRWPTEVRFLAVLDDEGAAIGLRGPEALLAQYSEWVATSQSSRRSGVVSVPDPLEPESPNLNLAAVPIRIESGKASLGIVLCAVRPTPRSVLAAGQAWSFFVGLAVIAVAGFALGSMYLHKSVVRPLLLLGRQSRRAGGLSDPAALPDRLPDEIGELARALAELQVDIEQWRQKSDRQEHRFAARIQTETARMTRELRRTERKAWTDPLTRLGNRQLLDEKIAEIFQAQRKSGDDLTIVMIDVDHFKTLNDTLGHQAGDDLLKFIGELLRQCVREHDLGIRYGGDEFLLILPGASAEAARVIAERTLRLFAQQTRLLQVEPKPTMSAGVASIRDHCPSSPQTLLQMADAALYVAKRGGKSRVTVFEDKLAVAATL